MSAFQATEVNIVYEGKPHLGAALGTQAYTKHYASCKTVQWADKLKKLPSIADIQPHIVYAAWSDKQVDVFDSNDSQHCATTVTLAGCHTDSIHSCTNWKGPSQ